MIFEADRGSVDDYSAVQPAGLRKLDRECNTCPKYFLIFIKTLRYLCKIVSLFSSRLIIFVQYLRIRAVVQKIAVQLSRCEIYTMFSISV